MVIKAIAEFTIQAGRRDELVSLFESLVAQHVSTLRTAGCTDSTLYAVVDDPDKAVEIADWESAEARDEAMQSEAMGVFAPLFELLSAPFGATVVKQWHRRGFRVMARGAFRRPTDIAGVVAAGLRLPVQARHSTRPSR